MRIDPVKVKEARELKGWTQADLAERMGVTAITVNRWEKDKLGLSVKRIKQLSKVLGIPAQELRQEA